VVPAGDESGADATADDAVDDGDAGADFTGRDPVRDDLAEVVLGFRSDHDEVAEVHGRFHAVA
jgi:hypothetical protein